MLLNIDIEGLKEEKLQLVKRLEQIDGILKLAETYATPVIMPTQEENKERFPNGLTSHNRQTVSNRRLLHVGTRKQILELLGSGPATLKELAKVLGIDESQLWGHIGPMVKDRMLFLNGQGFMQLAEEGKKRVAWFKEHPTFKTYRPDFQKQVETLSKYQQSHGPVGHA